MVELIWNKWTEKKVKNGKTEKAPLDGEAYTLRPTWQRLAFAVANIGIGVGIAVLLIGSQSRVVRTLIVLPPAQSLSKPKPGVDLRSVFIQGPQHLGKKGRVFPMEHCTLEMSREGKEMFLRVDGQRGHWWLALEGAMVNGKKASEAGVRGAILGAWAKGKPVGRWASGPASL